MVASLKMDQLSKYEALKVAFHQDELIYPNESSRKHLLTQTGIKTSPRASPDTE